MGKKQYQYEIREECQLHDMNKKISAKYSVGGINLEELTTD